MPECRLEEAAERAEQVREAIARSPVATPAGPVSATCSFGLARPAGRQPSRKSWCSPPTWRSTALKRVGETAWWLPSAEAAPLGVEEIPATSAPLAPSKTFPITPHETFPQFRH